MKVREIIEKLQTLDPEMEAAVSPRVYYPKGIDGSEGLIALADMSTSFPVVDIVSGGPVGNISDGLLEKKAFIVFDSESRAPDPFEQSESEPPPS